MKTDRIVKSLCFTVDREKMKLIPRTNHVFFELFVDIKNTTSTSVHVRVAIMQILKN